LTLALAGTERDKASELAQALILALAGPERDEAIVLARHLAPVQALAGPERDMALGLLFNRHQHQRQR